MPKKELPKFMITYLCRNCGQDFAITEQTTPECFYCEAKDNFEIIKKQELTPKVMAERMKLVADRLMENLKGAYATRPDEVEESELLGALSKAKKLKDQIQNLKLKEK